jgi:hypothetical protein
MWTREPLRPTTAKQTWPIKAHDHVEGISIERMANGFICIRVRNENDLWGRVDPLDLGAALIVRQSPKLTVSSFAHWMALHVAECQGTYGRAPRCHAPF